jgi:acetyl esterase
MTLHPQVQELLDELAAAPVPAIESLTPEQARNQMLAGTKLLGAGPEVAATEDLEMPGPAGSIALRRYQPLETSSAGAIVYFHGGGWVAGDLETHDIYCRALANATGAQVFAVDYRLAPEHPYPAASDDCYAATQWVIENAATWNIAADKIAVAGDSAGGNLAASVTLLARDRGGPEIAAQLLVYPATNCNFATESYLDFASKYQLTRDAMIWFWRSYVGRQHAPEAYAAPLRAENFANLPVAWIVTAEYDPLRDEGDDYANKLQEAGVEVEHHCYAGMIHGFSRRINDFDVSKQAVKDAAVFFKKHCA